MGLFQLSKAAKNDLRSIAIFTGNRWGESSAEFIYQAIG